MKKKNWIILIIAIIIVAIVAGAFFLTSNSNQGEVVKVGYLPSDHNAALFVAQAQKQYEKNNITVIEYQFNNGGDLMTAMASGDIDIGYVGITPALGSIQKGVPVKIVSGVQTEGSAVVVGSDSGITNITQLKGKEVASPGAYSIQNMLLMYELSKYGISIDEVNI